MEQYVVKYKVTGFGDEERTAGPYACIELAWENMDDIKGFEGVHSAYVAPVLEQERKEP